MKHFIFILATLLTTSAFAFDRQAILVSSGTVDLDNNNRADTIRIFYVQTKPSTETGFKKYDRVVVQADYGDDRLITVDQFPNSSNTLYKIRVIEDFQNDLDFDVQIGPTQSTSRTYLNRDGALSLSKEGIFVPRITPQVKADIYLKAVRAIKISNPETITLPTGMSNGEGVVVSSARAELNNDGYADFVEVRYSRTLPLSKGQKIQTLADLNEVSVIAKLSARDSEANEDYLRTVVIDKFENKSTKPFLIFDINDGRKDMVFDVSISRALDANLGETKNNDETFDDRFTTYENDGRGIFTKTHDISLPKISPEQWATWYKQTYDSITISHAKDPLSASVIVPVYTLQDVDAVRIKGDTLPPIEQPDIR